MGRRVRTQAQTLPQELAAAAAATPVWVVFWALPDREWESLAWDESRARTEQAERASDSTLARWGTAGLRGPVALSEWFAQSAPGLDGQACIDAVREVLARRARGDAEPVALRTG